MKANSSHRRRILQEATAGPPLDTILLPIRFRLRDRIDNDAVVALVLYSTQLAMHHVRF
jgi:hypothetical protein